MAHPTQQDIDEISVIFHEEMLLHTVHQAEPEEWDAWLLRHFHPEVWGIHAHYNWYPMSHRVKDHEDPVYTMKSFMDELQQQWNHLAKACHTLQWLTVDEQAEPAPCQKLALACVIMEGYYHADTATITKRATQDHKADTVESNRRKHYVHMSVYALRKDAPYGKNGWQIIGGIGGLPATGYVPRFDPVPGPNQIKEHHEDLVVQRLDETPDFDRHDVLYVNGVRADHEIGDRFHGWEVILNGRGL